MLKDELDYFVAHQEELAQQYFGKILVIKNKTLIGVYDNVLEAYLESQKENELGTFMIQPCERGVEAYTVTISSQEVFLQ